MFHLFFKTLRDRKIAFFVYCILAIVLLWMYILFFPSIAKQAQSYQQLSEDTPEGISSAFGLQDTDFSRLESFLAVEQFAFVWPLMVIFLMISFGTALLREKEKGTADILLAQPISRAHIYIETYLAGVYALILFTYLSIFTVIPLAELHHISYAVTNYITFSVIAFLFGLTILSFSSFVSAILSERGRSYMVIGGTLLLMQVFTIVAAIRNDVDWLEYLSLFHYYDAHVALGLNLLKTPSIIVLGASSLLFFFLGLIIFRKKDIPA